MGSLRSSWQIGHEFPASTISSFEGGEPYCCEKKKEKGLGELAVSPFFKFKQRSEKSYQSRLLSTGAIRYQTPSPTLHFCVLRDSAKYVPIHAIGETGMMSTRLPPMWPGFKSWRRRHMCRFSILLRKVSLQVIRLPLSSRQEVSLLKHMSNPSSI